MTIPPEHLKRVGLKSSKGQRALNEDNAILRDYAARPSRSRFLSLAAVADGMGGPGLGDLASDTAVKLLNEEFNRHRAEYAGNPALTSRRLLEQVFRVINTALLDMATLDAGLQGMGTTLTAFLAEEGKLTLAHVGDSRAYLVRKGGVVQLTRDHNLRSEAMEARLAGENATRAPTAYDVPSRVLGIQEEVGIDLYEFEVLPGDMVLLSTKGLHGTVKPEEIHKIVFEAAGGMQEACNQLVALAESRGSRDNITALLWQFPALSTSPSYHVTPAGQETIPVAPGASTNTVRIPSSGSIYIPFWERKLNAAIAFSILIAATIVGFVIGWIIF